MARSNSHFSLDICMFHPPGVPTRVGINSPHAQLTRRIDDPFRLPDSSMAIFNPAILISLFKGSSCLPFFPSDSFGHPASSILNDVWADAEAVSSTRRNIKKIECTLAFWCCYYFSLFFCVKLCCRVEEGTKAFQKYTNIERNCLFYRYIYIIIRIKALDEKLWRQVINKPRRRVVNGRNHEWIASRLAEQRRKWHRRLFARYTE